MTITSRPFGTQDLPRLLHFVGEWNAQTHFCGYLHPGDLCHTMSNILRGADPQDYFQLYEDASGELVGVVMIYPPRLSGFHVLVHPTHRGSALEAEMIAFGEQRTWAIMQEVGSDKTSVGTDVMDCDPIRRDVVLAKGYTTDEPYLYFTTRSVLDEIPEVQLPEGFIIRSVQGEHEADAVGAVHASAFDSNWQPGEYLKVMRSPAFKIDHELVVEAPDGRLAAFLVYWTDPVSKSALFEPVGCGKDFQRRGLTKALMYEAMKRMRAEGMETAIVAHEIPEKNPASTALYASVGFRHLYTIYTYRKQMSSG